MSDRTDTALPFSWAPILAVLGGAIGSAAWVSLIGGVLLALRLGKIDVPAGATVALVPSEQLAILGLGFVALPLLAALAAFLLLLFLRPREDVAKRLNQAGIVPTGLVAILIVLAILAEVALFQTGIASPIAQTVVGVLPLAAAVLIYFAVRKTDGFGEAALVLFVAVALCAGGVAAVNELGRPTRFDLAVVLRKDGSALGGYYVTLTPDALYLVTPTLIGAGSRLETAKQSPLPPGARPCRSTTTVDHLNGAPPRCYVAGLVSVPSDQVGKVMLGPPAIEVGVPGFNAARQLARVATARSDEERPATPTTPAASQPKNDN